jgi:hypothetical protein
MTEQRDENNVERFETLPLCDGCWQALFGDKVPSRLIPPETEVCARCDEVTRSGIYIRTRAAALKESR